MNICSFLLKRERSFLKKSYYNFNELLEKEYKKKICKEKHQINGIIYNYSPLVKNGNCRFCYGSPKKKDNEIFKLFLKHID